MSTMTLTIEALVERALELGCKLICLPFGTDNPMEDVEAAHEHAQYIIEKGAATFNGTARECIAFLNALSERWGAIP